MKFEYFMIEFIGPGGFKGLVHIKSEESLNDTNLSEFLGIDTIIVEIHKFKTEKEYDLSCEAANL